MTKARQVPPTLLTPEEIFWIQYPDAPYLLKVGDSIFLASGLSRAQGMARMAGIEIEKIYNPNLKTSTTDAS